jgi:ribosomal protein S18 acetylase RimI-like enzyme
MTEAPAEPLGVSVVRVDATSWQAYRDIRLAMLRGAPRAFWTTHEEAAARTDDEWRAVVDGSDVWLAVAGGRTVGSVASYQPQDGPRDQAFLVGMWVDPSARGRGVGELLVGTVLDEARARGLRRVVLDVAHENAPAVRLYERMGFVATGGTAVMPHDPSITEFEMERLLG